MEQVRSPRAVFVDHPAGRTFGPPGEQDRHKKVLAAALSMLPRFTSTGQILDLPDPWEPDGNRTWEAALREELLKPLLDGPIIEKVIRLQP